MASCAHVQPAEGVTRRTPAALRDVHRSISDGCGQTALQAAGFAGLRLHVSLAGPGTRGDLCVSDTHGRPPVSWAVCRAAGFARVLAEQLSPRAEGAAWNPGGRSSLRPLSPRPARRPHSNNPGLFLSASHPLMSSHFFPSGLRPHCFEDSAFLRQGKGCPPGQTPALLASVFPGTWLGTFRTASAHSSLFRSSWLFVHVFPSTGTLGL